MAHKNWYHEETQKFNLKRCANPLNVDSHVGKDLWDISNSLLKVFPNLHEKFKVAKIVGNQSPSHGKISW